MPRMVDGGRPCPGKIWVQRGRPPVQTVELCIHISYHNSGTLIDTVMKMRTINANRMSIASFPTSHQPRLCVTANFPKMWLRIPQRVIQCTQATLLTILALSSMNASSLFLIKSPYCLNPVINIYS